MHLPVSVFGVVSPAPAAFSADIVVAQVAVSSWVCLVVSQEA